MRKAILVIVAWLGMFYLNNSFSDEMTEASPNWEALKIDLHSGGVLHFSVPPGMDANFLGQRHETQLDISNDAIYRKYPSGPKYFEAFNRVWDFKGWFWQGDLGNLMLDILVMKKEKPGSLDSFERLLQEQDDADVSTTAVYKERWLKYRLLPRWGDALEYTTILDESHYLTARFKFINNSDAKGSWRKKAQEYADGIAETLVFERTSP